MIWGASLGLLIGVLIGDLALWLALGAASGLLYELICRISKAGESSSPVAADTED